MNNKLQRLLLFFIIFLIVIQVFSKTKTADPAAQEDILISGAKQFAIGENMEFTLKNNTPTPLALKTECWPISLSISRYQNGAWTKMDLPNTQTECKEEAVALESGASTKISLNPWRSTLFKEIGHYQATFAMPDGRLFNHEFDIKEPSIFRNFWNTFLYRPIFNTLIFLIKVIPGHNLGLAIIVLTLIIKLILLGPNQKALKSQKKMQLIQPQLEALKIKYEKEPQKLAQATMEIWKKNKVSPAGSCLPLLIQFPILIALFYVVKTDFRSTADIPLLYDSLKAFSFSFIQTKLFGLDLTQKNIIVLPVIVGLLQFFQMRLSLGKQKISLPTKDQPMNPNAMMSQMMIYMMPVMIAFFTATLPAAVGFYWGASTLFGIAQQVVVNRSKS